MTVPSITREFFELIETKLPGGKWIAKALLGLVVLAMFGGLLYLMYGAGTALLAKLPTSIPVKAEPKDWISLAVIVALFVGGFVFIQRRLSKIENTKPVDHDVRNALRAVVEGQTTLRNDLANLTGRF
jgi:hypothetical protein